MNKIGLIIIILLVIFVGGYFVLKGGSKIPLPNYNPEQEVSKEQPQPKEQAETLSKTDEVQEITVIGSEFYFSPSQITVDAGKPVKITFQNNGGSPHDLVIEELGARTSVIGGGRTEILEFTPSSAGSYTFFCSVGGHRVAGMEGHLEVK